MRIYHAFIDQALAFGALDAADATLSDASRAAEDRAWQNTYGLRRSSYSEALDLLLDAARARLAAVNGPSA